MSRIEKTFTMAPAHLKIKGYSVNVLGPGSNFDYRLDVQEVRRIVDECNDIGGELPFTIMRTWDEDEDWIGVDIDEEIDQNEIYEIWL